MAAPFAALDGRQPQEHDMSRLADFAIVNRWPAREPQKLQLYSLNTPNGVKVSIMLEETGLAYEPHLVDFAKGDQRSPEFLSLNPNGKIPGDHRSRWPGWTAAVAIRVRRDTRLPRREDRHVDSVRSRARRWETIQWVFFQMAAIGPMFGQVGFFHKFDGKEFADKRPLDHYVAETQRLLGILDARLDGRRWIMGDDYTIADIALIGPVRNLITFYEARDAGRV